MIGFHLRIFSLVGKRVISRGFSEKKIFDYFPDLDVEGKGLSG